MRAPWNAYTATGVPISALSKKSGMRHRFPGTCAGIISRSANRDETGKSIQVCRHGLTQGLPCSVLAGKELIGGDEVDGTEVDTDPVCERMAGDGVVRPCLLCTYTSAS